MTYASGGLISATDYNTLVSNGSNIGDQWGVGTSSHGLGQSTTAIASLAAGATVTATQWSSLISTINNCLAHEGQATITPTSVATGNTITYYNTIATGSAAAYANSGTTGLALSASAASNATYTGTWGTTGYGVNRAITLAHTVTFASGDAARYFFNAGGTLSLTFSKSGGSATTRNTDWAALATASGTITIGYKNTTKTGGSGSTTTLLNANNGGYWNSSSTQSTHFMQYDASAGYTQDYIQVILQTSGTLSNGGSPTITVYSVWANGHVQAFQDAVDGSSTASLVVNSPATTYLTNSWGTPTVTPGAALN